MNFLKGVENFLIFVNDNWTSIVIIIGLFIALFQKVKKYANKSDEEKVAIAKKQINEIMLRLVTEAELDYSDWSEAGSIKRAEVIEKIFAKYPILTKVVDQDALITFIDESIDESLKNMKEMLEKNNSTSTKKIED